MQADAARFGRVNRYTQVILKSALSCGILTAPTMTTRVSMQRTILIALFAVLGFSQMVSAQSLGDVARLKKQNKSPQADSASAPAKTKKVYSNEDMGTKSTSSTDAGEKKPAAEELKPTESSGDREAEKKMAAGEWRAKISEQKDAIASIQQRIEKLQASIHYVQNNRNVYVNGPEYNQAQDRKQREVEYLKSILEERKTTLQEMQEEARQQGFGSAVYQ